MVPSRIRHEEREHLVSVPTLCAFGGDGIAEPFDDLLNRFPEGAALAPGKLGGNIAGCHAKIDILREAPNQAMAQGQRSASAKNNTAALGNERCQSTQNSDDVPVLSTKALQTPNAPATSSISPVQATRSKRTLVLP